MTNKSKLTTQDILQGAERYLAQTEVYKNVTMQRLADFLGIGIRIVHRLLPASEWVQLQRTWMLNRLKQAIEISHTASGMQEDFTLENVASQAGIPSNTIHRFLTKDEWQPLLTIDSITPQEGTVSQEASSVSTYYIHQAKLYLAQTEKYEMAAIKPFAASLGEPAHRIWKHLPTYQWETLRNTWIQNRLRRAMDDAYAEAKTQEDFTLKNIAAHAEIPYCKVRRFIDEDEWQVRRATLPRPQKALETNSHYLQQAEIYLTQTQCYEDVMLKRFAKSLGVAPQTVSERLPNHQWEQLRNRWIEKRLKQAIDAVFAEAKTPNDFTIVSIARHSGIPPHIVSRHLSKDEWQARQKKIISRKPSPLQQLRLQQLSQAIYKVYAAATTQHAFTLRDA